MNVKAKKRGRPRKSPNALTPETIISCAKELMRAEGKIPSIRKISGNLDVDAMAIYHYFANKNALLEAVTVSLVEEIHTPTKENPWQEELLLLCQSYLTLLKEHPGLLEIFLSMTTDGPEEVFHERLRSTLAPLPLDELQLTNLRDLLADYLHGFAFSMACNQTEEALTIKMSNGPLAFLIRAIEREATST